jgi:ABC-type transport system substrate-binding protein
VNELSETIGAGVKRLIVMVLLIGVFAAACGAAEETVAQESTTTAPAVTTTELPSTTTTSTTLPPTTTTTMSDEIQTSRVIEGEDPDVDAIVEAYLVVFDSATTFDEKSLYITDPSGLEETVTKYAAAGDDAGGITLQADRVGIDGTEARVIYSFLFAGNTTYSDLEGEAVLTDDGWQITREFFCEIMGLARVGCP